ncbi:Peptidyl-prolyl cis-trans isomerase B [Galdieria sulphuraria]|nr:Peptidyl-prolyl cis-trans isomerase B [Galdieria sulphuraria]
MSRRHKTLATLKCGLRCSLGSFSRRDFITLTLAVLPVPFFSFVESGPNRKPTVTNRVYFDISVGNEYLGRMVFDLYGRDAPETVSTFLQFLKGVHNKDRTKDLNLSDQKLVEEEEEDLIYSEEPFVSYDFSLFYRCSPGILLEGGKIPNLRLTSVGDTTFYDIGGALIAANPQVETNSLKHTERGLLTRKRLQFGPEFGITLAGHPELDVSHTVFGKLEQGYEVLEAIESLPVLVDSNRREGRDVFHDKRADEIYPNKLLRRVAVISSGML